MRHPEAVQPRSRRLFHRLSSCEFAVRAYKRDSIGSSEEGAASARDMRFPGGSFQGISGNRMPPYAAAMDMYRPPSGVEVLRVDGAAVRPEQKSVPLLLDLIRLFAPKASDIVVDPFAGTMSTVVACLYEGRAVYACEMDEKCFTIGRERVVALAVRRAAHSLAPGLAVECVATLKKCIEPAHLAADILDGETRGSEYLSVVVSGSPEL
jgi:hypothetical protein